MKKAIKLSEYVNTGTSKGDAQAVERFCLELWGEMLNNNELHVDCSGVKTVSAGFVEHLVALINSALEYGEMQE